MSHPWSNYGNHIYNPNIPAATNMHWNNINPAGVKPKAYINPRIMKLDPTLLDNNQTVVSKKILVNPNFKGNNTSFLHNLETALGCGKSSLHVNSNFELGVPNTNISTSIIPAPVTNQPQEIKSTDQVVPDSTLNIPRSKPSSTLINLSKSRFSKCNVLPAKKDKVLIFSSNYYWSKESATKQFAPPIQSPNYKYVKKKCPQYKTSPVKMIKSATPELNTKLNLKIQSLNPSVSKKLPENVYKFEASSQYKVINLKSVKLNPITKTSPTVKRKNTILRTKTTIINYSKSGPSTSVNNNLSLFKSPVNNRKKFFSESISLPLKPYGNSSSVVKMANIVKSKYKYTNKASLHNKKQFKMLPDQIRKYKVDKRKNVIVNNQRKANKSYDIKRLFPRSGFAGRLKRSLIWTSSHWNKFTSLPNKKWRKPELPDKEVMRTGMSFPNQTLVNIGGIMYKSTMNKLTRARDKKRVSETSTAQLKPSQCINQGNKHHIVYVRGEKFLLDSNGKTLVRQPSTINEQEKSKKCSVTRVDIGGVTYIQKSSNILMRTNTHQARYVVNHAKQKSIALLSSLHKRNNMPCVIYQKFGTCTRHKKGLCIYVHDPKNVSLCKKFLKGECDNPNCLLSHNMVKEKMATCHFFLNGSCSRENCPYLHVKVNKKADICKNFLQGFCKLGQNCTKRHIHQCPEFDSKGICHRGNNCPYPHKTQTTMKTSKPAKTSKLPKPKGESKEVEPKKTIKLKPLGASKRDSKPRVRKRKKEEMNIPVEGNDDTSIIECIPKRIKLDELPVFIPLHDK